MGPLIYRPLMRFYHCWCSQDMTTHLRSPSWNFVRARLINKFTTQTELKLVWWYKREDCLKFLPMHYIISWEDRSKFPLRISQSKRSAAYQLLMTQDVNVSSLEGGLGDNDKNILWLLSFCFISLGNCQWTCQLLKFK